MVKKANQSGIMSPGWYITVYQFFNLLAYSVHGRDIAAVRFAREPVLLFLLMLLFWKGKSNQRFESTGVYVIIILFFSFVLYAVFNTWFSLAPVVSFQYFLWLFAALVFIYMLIWGHPKQVSIHQLLAETSTKLFYLHLAFIFTSYFVGYGLGVESYFDLRYNDFSSDFDLEFGGIFASTNAFGILLFQTVGLGIIAAVFSEGISRKFYYTSSGILGLLVIQVNNRSSILCLALMLLMLLIFYYKQYLLTIFIGAGIIAFFILNSEILFNKLRLGQFEGERRFGNRTELFEEGIQIAGEMDFFGVGYYNQRKSRYTYGIADPNEHEMTFHNTYMATLVEFGYVGFLIFIGSIGYMLQRGIWAIKSQANRPTATLVLCILLALMMGHSTVEDSFNFPGSPTFNFFWFQLLVLLALTDEPETA